MSGTWHAWSICTNEHMRRTFTNMKGNETTITCNVSFTFVSLMFSFLASFLGIQLASSSPHYILSFECAYQCSQSTLCAQVSADHHTVFHFLHDVGCLSSSLLCIVEYHFIAWATLSLILHCTDIWVALHVSSQKATNVNTRKHIDFFPYRRARRVGVLEVEKPWSQSRNWGRHFLKTSIFSVCMTFIFHSNKRVVFGKEGCDSELG